jgi:hypothetical protein
MFLRGWKWTVDENDRANWGQVTRRAKRNRIVDTDGGAVDPIALGAAERQLLPIECKEILAEKLAKPDEQMAGPPNDRIVAANRTFGLADVSNEQKNGEKGENPDRNDKQRCKKVQTFHHDRTDNAHKIHLFR